MGKWESGLVRHFGVKLHVHCLDSAGEGTVRVVVSWENLEVLSSNKHFGCPPSEQWDNFENCRNVLMKRSKLVEK